MTMENTSVQDDTTNVVIEQDLASSAQKRYMRPILVKSGITQAIFALTFMRWQFALAIFLLIVTLIWWISRHRVGWGDQVWFQANQLRLKQAGEIRKIVPAVAVTLHSIRKDCAVIVWLENRKKKSLIMGREGFSDENWAALERQLDLFFSRRDLVAAQQAIP
jgi:hypothetical protein